MLLRQNELQALQVAVRADIEDRAELLQVDRLNLVLSCVKADLTLCHLSCIGRCFSSSRWIIWLYGRLCTSSDE